MVTRKNGPDIDDLVHSVLRIVRPPKFAYRISWFIAVPNGAPDVFCGL